jgi:hypothetical protein
MIRVGIFAALLLVASQALAKNILGGLENIEIQAQTLSGNKVSLPFEARIDTGATETCLNATQVKRFDRAGVAYVQFRTRSGGNEYDLQAPFVKVGSVRSSNGIAQKRAFVRLDLCVGNQRISTVVSLADRHAMRQPVLVGRSLLHGRYVVDVDENHAAGNPDCN